MIPGLLPHQIPEKQAVNIYTKKHRQQVHKQVSSTHTSVWDDLFQSECTWKNSKTIKANWLNIAPLYV